MLGLICILVLFEFQSKQKARIHLVAPRGFLAFESKTSKLHAFESN
jgi:hypothetical protein